MSDIKRMANYMVKVMAETIMEDFSYTEGKAIFAALADVMDHVDKTNARMSDEFDVLYLESRLKFYLGKEN